MKLQQLKYLLAIVDNGLNITAAAERMYTSQPGVSKQLKLLEEELGMQLFTRKGKSLGGITAAGHQVIDRARIIMREADNIRSLASDYYQEEEGSLSIATTHTQARYVLPEIVAEFRKRFPKVGLNLHQGTSEQIADMVSSNNIDFAIATGSTELFGDLMLVPSYRWDRSIVVPNGHKLAALDRKITLQDLAEYPLVTYVFSFGGQSSLKRAFADQGLGTRRRLHGARRRCHQDLCAHGSRCRNCRQHGSGLCGPEGLAGYRRGRPVPSKHHLDRLPEEHGFATLYA